MNKKAWIIFALVVIVALGGLIIASKDQNSVDVSNVNANAIQPADKTDGGIADHVFGDKNSKVILIEYGDFECPYCGEDYPGIKAVVDKYQGQIAFIFRNFPLTTIHPNALAAAAAAEAAGLQGKYWQMHDALYTNQNDWVNDSASQRTASFDTYAKSIGLNITTFNNDLSSTAVSQKIGFDQAVATKIGVDATPTLYLNGTQLSDEVVGTQASLDSSVAAAIKKAGIALPTAN